MGLFNFLSSNKQKDAEFVIAQNDKERWCLDTYSLWCASTGGDPSKLGGRFSKKSATTILKRDWMVSISKGCCDSFLVEYIKPVIDMESTEKSELAWEYSLCGQLLCLGYSAEIITRDQYNQNLFELAKKYQQQFKSWEDMVEQYFIGYENATGNTEGVNYRKEVYQVLNGPNSPNFKTHWNTSF